MNDVKDRNKIEIGPHADGICCDGGGGALGHPKVWYSFNDKQTSITCGYCDRIFVRKT